MFTEHSYIIRVVSYITLSGSVAILFEKAQSTVIVSLLGLTEVRFKVAAVKLSRICRPSVNQCRTLVFLRDEGTYICRRYNG